jgi:large subunit ribosomal protein L31
MKKEGHPPYQEILFVDSSTGFRFVCGSTLQPKEKEVFEGKEYPVYRVPVSSASHPFFTGSSSFIDSEGRVDKFVKRYAKKAEQHKEEGEKEEEAAKQAAAKKKTKKKSTST